MEADEDGTGELADERNLHPDLVSEHDDVRGGQGEEGDVEEEVDADVRVGVDEEHQREDGQTLEVEAQDQGTRVRDGCELKGKGTIRQECLGEN